MSNPRPGAGGNNLLLRNINSLKRSYPSAAETNNSTPKMFGSKFKMPSHNNGSFASSANNFQQQLAANNSGIGNHHHHHLNGELQQRQPHQSSDKFSAFGLFLTSSLLDMPENKALGLIEKFTNDIVRALIDPSTPLSSAAVAAAAAAEAAASTPTNSADEIAHTPASANSLSTVEENNI